MSRAHQWMRHPHFEAESELMATREQILTTHNAALIAIIADLEAAVADIYAKADDYLRSSKSYTCRGNSEIRAGMIKGAAVMRVDASKVQAVIDKHKGQADAGTEGVVSRLAEVPEQPQAQSRDVATETQPADQDQGHVDVPDVQEGDGHA